MKNYWNNYQIQVLTESLGKQKEVDKKAVSAFIALTKMQRKF